MSMKSKITKMVACTTLVGAGLVGAGASPALAGCGVTVYGHNTLGSTATIHWADSDVRTSTVALGIRAKGPWKSLGSSTTAVSPGDTRSKAFTLDLGCNIDRQYRLWVTEGGSSFWEYFPANTSNWTRNLAPTVQIN